MKRKTVLAAAATAAIAFAPGSAFAKAKWAIAIHGGAGVIDKSDMTPELAAQYRAALKKALQAGETVLRRGGDSVSAVEAAVNVMEDSPLFNAGRGAALDETGMARHDSAIMRGADHAAGAIAGSTRIRNPISAARAVMEKTEVVMLAGEGADWFAAQSGLTLADPLYFQTDARRAALMQVRAKQAKGVHTSQLSNPQRFGTVGAVALDSKGNLAAGTSTGGLTNKKFGRIGDSPLIGSGTYASNTSCAVSGTGHGEAFIRWTAARDVCALVEYKGLTIAQAGEQVIQHLKTVDGGGGLIALDPDGTPEFGMNGTGMYRGFASDTVPGGVAIYVGDKLR